MAQCALIVLSGPSGCGKSTLRKLLEKDARIRFSVSDTTRSPRPGEVDGVDYRFVDREAFEAGIAAGGYLEYARVHGNYYGTPRRPVEELLEKGLHVLLDIDVQGAEQLRRRGVDGLYVMLVPPTLEVLRERLERRGSDAPEEVESRLRTARLELERRDLYDHVVVNDDLARAHREILRIAGLEPAGGEGAGNEVQDP